MKKLHHNHGTLAYSVEGSGSSLLFVHGFSLDYRMWQPQIDHFKSTHQVIIPDLRGFGRSSLPSQSYSHHEDLLALLDQLEVDQAHIVGLSLGGEIAIDLTLSYPQRVKSLALFSSSLGGYASTVNWDVGAKTDGVLEAKKKWLNHEVFAPTKKSPPASSLLQRIVDDYSGWHWLHHDPRVKLEPTALDRLHEITRPILIAVGDKDLSYYHDIAQILSTTISRATLVKIPKAGHMINLEQPGQANQLLETFWQVYSSIQ